METELFIIFSKSNLYCCAFFLFFQLNFFAYFCIFIVVET